MNTSIYAQATAVTALLGVVTSALMVPLTAQAQDTGNQTQLSLSQSLSADRNAGLSASNSDTSLQAQTTIDFNRTYATRTETFDLRAIGVLRGSWLEGVDADFTFTPRVALSYNRDGASSALSLQANATRSEIAFTNALTDFLDADGNLDLPDDFDDLTGTGTRQSLSFSGSLSLRTDSPFGLTLNASYSDLSYQDVTSSDLVDSRSASFGISGRFNINETTDANLGLRYRTSEDDAGASSDTIGLSGGVSFAQPGGSFGLSASLNDLSGTPTAGFQVNRSLELRNGSISGSLGLNRNADNDITTTGSLRWNHEMERTNITAQLRRSVTSDRDDDDSVVTSLSLGTSYALTPTSSVSLNTGYVLSEQTSADTETGLANLGISYSHTLTEDWSLSAGASYRSRTSTGEADAEATSLSLTLNRTFAARD